MSSSVVVTGSWMTAASSSRRFSPSSYIFGQSVIFGPMMSFVSGCGWPKPL